MTNKAIAFYTYQTREGPEDEWRHEGNRISEDIGLAEYHAKCHVRMIKKYDPQRTIEYRILSCKGHVFVISRKGPTVPEDKADA